MRSLLRILGLLLVLTSPLLAQTKHAAMLETNNNYSGRNAATGAGTIIATDAPYDFTFNLEEPTAADTGKWQHRLLRATTVVEITCNTKGSGTASINILLRPIPNGSGTHLLTQPLTCDLNENVATTFAVTAIPARSYLALEIAAASTPFVEVHVSVQPNTQ